MAIKLSESEMRDLLARAREAADEAFAGAIPTPMVVGTPRHMAASLTGDNGGGFDPAQPVYHVAEGACGFGWVNVRPGTSRFARFLKRTTRASASYYGGIDVWCGDMLSTNPPARQQQSYARWSAAANAFASVLTDAGIEALAMSRLD